MNGFTVNLLENEIQKLAERLSKLEAGTDEYKATLDDLTQLTTVYNSDRKSRGEFALASVEVSKEEFNESHETKKLELEKDKLKVENKKVHMDTAKDIGKGALAVAATAMAVYADQKGLFVSKTGLNVAPDIKI